MITLNSASFIAKDIFQLRSNEIGIERIIILYKNFTFIIKIIISNTIEKFKSKSAKSNTCIHRSKGLSK